MKLFTIMPFGFDFTQMQEDEVERDEYIMDYYCNP